MKTFPFEIELKDGKKVILKYQDDSSSRAIHALANQNVIATVSFEVIKTFSHNLSFKKVLKDGKKPYRPLGEHKLRITILETQTSEYDIRGDKLYTNGLEYSLEKAICTMKNIDIYKPDYIGIGLGSSLYREMEEIAREEKCESVHAFVAPPPGMERQTLKFYDRNGFTINNGFLRSAEKRLDK